MSLEFPADTLPAGSCRGWGRPWGVAVGVGLLAWSAAGLAVYVTALGHVYGGLRCADGHGGFVVVSENLLYAALAILAIAFTLGCAAFFFIPCSWECAGSAGRYAAAPVAAPVAPPTPPAAPAPVIIAVLSSPHPPRDACPVFGCETCARRDCPLGDKLHYLFRGCPSCRAAGR